MLGRNSAISINRTSERLKRAIIPKTSTLGNFMYVKIIYAQAEIFAADASM